MAKRELISWVKWLRSGVYKQGRNKLVKDDLKSPTEDLFCCLGVACDLHAREKGKGWVRDRYLEQEGTLPVAVLSWLGINDYHQGKLIGLNDSGGSFKKIADYIEKEIIK